MAKPKTPRPEKPAKATQPHAELPEALDIKKLGRPSRYDPSYCELAIELGATGKSKTQIAAAIGVVRDTLSNWAAANPEFAQAMKFAKELEMAWWESVGQTNMTRSGFNATAFIFQMKNRFREDYRDSSELTGKDGKDLIPEPSNRDLARAVYDLLRSTKAEASDAAQS